MPSLRHGVIQSDLVALIRSWRHAPSRALDRGVAITEPRTFASPSYKNLPVCRTGRGQTVVAGIERSRLQGICCFPS